KNIGQSDLTLNAATIVGPTNTAWTWSGATLPITLAPGMSQDIQLCYNAASRGPNFDTLMLAGITSGRPITQSLVIEGLGQQACATSMPAVPGPVTFGTTSKTMVGNVDTAMIIITNCGDFNASYTAQLT